MAKPLSEMDPADISHRAVDRRCDAYAGRALRARLRPRRDEHSVLSPTVCETVTPTACAILPEMAVSPEKTATDFAKAVDHARRRADR